ncbi:MAG: hypothetical protein AAF734_07120, partial [Bacteroidota bacterium]
MNKTTTYTLAIVDGRKEVNLSFGQSFFENGEEKLPSISIQLLILDDAPLVELCSFLHKRGIV